MKHLFPIGTAVSPFEAQWLAQLAEGRRVIEIGAWLGFSACVMSTTAELVVSVDHHRGDAAHPMSDNQGDPAHPDGSTLAEFRRNVEQYAVCPVLPILGLSPAALRPLATGHFGMAFIDGDHNELPVWADALACQRVLNKKGIMAFHDYGDGYCEGVTASVDRYADETGLKLHHGVDSLVWFVLP